MKLYEKSQEETEIVWLRIIDPEHGVVYDSERDHVPISAHSEHAEKIFALLESLDSKVSAYFRIDIDGFSYQRGIVPRGKSEKDSQGN